MLAAAKQYESSASFATRRLSYADRPSGAATNQPFDACQLYVGTHVSPMSFFSDLCMLLHGIVGHVVSMVIIEFCIAWLPLSELEPSGVFFVAISLSQIPSHL